MPRSRVIVEVQSEGILKVCCDCDGKKKEGEENCIYLPTGPRRDKKQSQDTGPQVFRPPVSSPLISQLEVRGMGRLPLISQLEVESIGRLLGSLPELAMRVASAREPEGVILVKIRGVNRLSLRELRPLHGFVREHSCNLLLRFM
jgi:hypothetical protein